MGPCARRRAGWTHWPSCVSRAVVYSLKPSVRNSGTQPGASTWTTWWTTLCAMASVRSPTAIASSNLVTGSIATHTQCGARDRRWIASASLTSPALIALSKAKSSSKALVGFQGRGFADVVQPNCGHPFLLEALHFQWPSIRRCASRTMSERKTPESNKSVLRKERYGLTTFHQVDTNG